MSRCMGRTLQRLGAESGRRSYISGSDIVSGRTSQLAMRIRRSAEMTRTGRFRLGRPKNHPPLAGGTRLPPPTLDQVTDVAESLERGAATAADTASWAEEQLALFGLDDQLDIDTLRALASLLETARRS